MPKTPKTPKPETPVEDAFTRLDNLYHFPMGEQPNSEIRLILAALWESKSEEQYFETITKIDAI